MFHASIYRAALGSVIVVEGGDCEFAIAGGNVCLAAQRFGISGLIIDGVIRDAEEVREALFPVYARGLMPKPGVKKSLGTLATPVTCGGVHVALGDVVVADEEGIVVLPAADATTLLARAVQADQDERATTLDDWIDEHRTRIAGLLEEYGYQEDVN
jgi:regulator of RNase E activity RraA